MSDERVIGGFVRVLSRIAHGYAAVEDERGQAIDRDEGRRNQ